MSDLLRTKNLPQFGKRLRRTSSVYCLQLLAAPFLYRFVRGVRYVVAPPRAQSASEPGEAPLTDLQRQLLRLLANRDDAQILFEEAAEQLRVAKLILQKTCEELTERGYIQPVDTVCGVSLSRSRATAVTS